MQTRRTFLASAGALALAGCDFRPSTAPASAAPVEIEMLPDPGFLAWVAGFRPRALASGIPEATYDAAFAAMGYIPEVVARHGRQGEFTLSMADYMARNVSDSRIENGRRELAARAPLFAAVEARYEVEKEVVAAIWGIESAYGTRRGDFPVPAALASLAYAGRRVSFNEEQLLAALRILADGHVAPRNMKGSWAGAMGHTQFIPTSFLALAVDFTGDGRRDIWADDPADALASTANYLARSGWRQGLPWGVEVRLPSGFDLSSARRSNTRSGAAWAEAGLRRASGSGALPEGGLLLPAGGGGPALIVTRNFTAIERYNQADAYVIAVGHLADRLRGGSALRTAWPEGTPLSFADRQAMQEALTARGHDTKGADGLFGPNTEAAIRAYQAEHGLPEDGFATLDLLRHLLGD